MPISYTPVTVDLRVDVEATTNVEILNNLADTRSGAVVCAATLPVGCLFTDSSNGVFEFWEPQTARGTLLGKIADGSNTVLQAHPGLAGGLQNCLTSLLDASAAPIFTDYPADYQSLSDIGELALGYAAHSMFGHVAATAAIVNDQAIADYINGVGPTNADLGKKLEDAILNLAGGEAGSAATEIVNRVIGQDAARARDEDNNEYAPNVHRALPFAAGDKIYVAVTLKDWTSSRENSGAGTAQAYLGEMFTNQQYYFLITLE